MAGAAEELHALSGVEPGPSAKVKCERFTRLSSFLRCAWGLASEAWAEGLPISRSPPACPLAPSAGEKVRLKVTYVLRQAWELAGILKYCSVFLLTIHAEQQRFSISAGINTVAPLKRMYSYTELHKWGRVAKIRDIRTQITLRDDPANELRITSIFSGWEGNQAASTSPETERRHRAPGSKREDTSPELCAQAAHTPVEGALYRKLFLKTTQAHFPQRRQQICAKHI